MNVEYLVGFDTGEENGKAKGTSEKADYIRQKFDEFSLISPETSRLPRVSFLFELFYVISISRRNCKPDAIILRTYFPSVVILFTSIFGIYTILDVHAKKSEEISFLNSPVKYVGLFISHLDTVVASNFSSGTVFNNPILLDYWKCYIFTNTTLGSVYNGSDPRKFYRVKKSSARSRLDIKTSKPIYLFVGSVSPWHGVEKILCAADLIDRGIVYVVGGRGRYYHQIKDKYGSSNVVFTGRVSNKKAMLFMNAADVGLLPVNNYRVSPGSPLKLFDYLLCGLPVITEHNTTGYSDVVRRAPAGKCISYDDTSVLARTMQNSTVNRTVREEISQWGLRNVSWVVRAKQWFDFVTKCARK